MTPGEYMAFLAGVSLGVFSACLGLAIALSLTRKSREEKTVQPTPRIVPPKGGSGTAPPKVANIPTMWPDLPLMPPPPIGWTATTTGNGGTTVWNHGDFRWDGDPPAGAPVPR